MSAIFTRKEFAVGLACALAFGVLCETANAQAVVVVRTDCADARFDAACQAAGVDFWLEKRHLQAHLLGFLQQRFAV